MGKQKKLIIFIIEGQKSIRDSLKEYLSSDFEVHLIEVATEAIQKAAEKNPDVILLDLEIPNIDGYELIKLFKSHPATISIPIVIMSESNDLEIRGKLEQIGASGFFKKPLEYASLSKDIRGYLSALNSKTQSANLNRSFHITYNDKEKSSLIKEKILDVTTQGTSVIVLSWQKGEDFFGDEVELQKLLEENKVIFLEIQPSLIVKYPYLQDLSPLLSDILDFLENDPKNYHLIFDEPRNLINVYDKKSALSKSFILAKLLKQYFDQYSIFNTRPRNNDASVFQQKLAKVFVG
jgi:two-component system chemotaxis response regulator CheY